jgi:geranylgeranyl pyrophosphate synthase
MYLSISAQVPGTNKLLKSRGEDIAAGKVTFPLLKAIELLPADEVTELWHIVKSKPQDQAVIDRCIDKLEACGAIEACCADSKRMVNEAWEMLDRSLPQSYFKIMLRTLGLFVTADQSEDVVSARC